MTVLTNKRILKVTRNCLGDFELKISLSYPNTLMLVSKTETTTSLSNETSLITSLNAFSNSSISPRTYK